MGTSTTRTRFPYFWEVPSPDGAEGWEEMYPAYLISQEANRSAEDELFWVQNAMHAPLAVKPFETISVEAIQFAAGVYNTRIFSVPQAMGMHERISNGYRYMAPIEIHDGDLIARRAAEFQERAGYYYANWDRLFDDWLVKVKGNIEALRAIEIPLLPDLEDKHVVTDGLGVSSGYGLLAAYNDLISRYFLMFQHHFEMANIGHAALGVFTHFCQTVFPGTSGQTIARMLSGRELVAYRPDEELRGLARRAVELGVQDLVRAHQADPHATVAIASTEAGREWLVALEAAKDPWFYFVEGSNFYHDEPAWIDDLRIPLSGIANYIDQLENGDELARPTDRLRAEGEEIVAQHRADLSGDTLAQFDQLLAIATKVVPFSQDHSFYGEHWFGTIWWHRIRELAARLVERGLLAQPDDFFLFHRHELSEMIQDVVTAWGIGAQPTGSVRIQAIADRRRAIMAALREHRPEPAVGEPPAAITNPLLVSHVGVTTDVVQRWLADTVQEQQLTGTGASPGAAEGPCRIVRTVEDLDQIERGDILICQTTTPAWGRVFSRLGGLVSDSGGMMSHAAVVAREYAIPAVVGTVSATLVLTSGDRIRVDGDSGVVTVLQSAAN